jgi:hypothetical protein
MAVKQALDLLSGTFMIRQLQPWYENIGKRQVKSPKVYIRDSGLLHTLLGLDGFEALLDYPKLGASWEGFALEETIRHYEVDAEDCYFWATHNRAELDLLMFKNGKKLGFEFKYSSAPKITPSMKVALSDLHLDCLTVIIPGIANFALSEQVQVRGLESLA